jgi:hypothetical protein
MPARPSEPILQLLRETARKMGLNTAALAQAASIERGRLKHILSGSEPITVDELISLSQALKLDAATLAGAEEVPAVTHGGESEEEEEGEEGGTLLTPFAKAPSDSGEDLRVDPLGNHTEQILKVGLILGVDLFLHLDTTLLEDSGIPKDTLKRYRGTIPLRLDAAYHRHHDLQFLREGVQLKLSFDALYTCVLPWSAFQQITFIPLPPDPPEPEVEEEEPVEEPPSVARRGHLRLV